MTTKKGSPLPSRILPPPALDSSTTRALNTYGTARDEQGRVSRSTGRNVKYGTIVTADFKEWMKSESKRSGKKQCVLLEDMRAAYVKVQSDKVRKVLA